MACPSSPDAGKFLYHASGAADAVGCVEDPSRGGCAKAAFMGALTVGTGGGDEVTLLGAGALEGATDVATGGDGLLDLCGFSPFRIG
ncbi:hypothetical protein ACFW1M_29095 [Streptomyces inhibens]|uniref:hypothetical protein n=1 Tax=Streptomyces inhibens TaxID=2293571 RepID=UPI0036C0AC29